MKTAPHNDASADWDRRAVQAAVQRLGQLLPRQAPIRDFVSQNKLQAFQHLPFAQALEAAETATGICGYPPEAEFRAFFAAGRITETDLQTVFEHDAQLADAEPIATSTGCAIRLRDIYRIAMLFGVDPLTPAELAWRLQQQNCLRNWQADVPLGIRELMAGPPARGNKPASEERLVHDLWDACLELFKLEQFALHPEALVDLSRSQAEDILSLFNARAAGDQSTDSSVHQAMRLEERSHLERCLAEVGHRYSCRCLLLNLTGKDLLDEVRPMLIRIAAAHLDEGLAPWHDEHRPRGLYAAWRARAGMSFSLSLADLPGWRAALRELPDDACEAVAVLLRHLDIPEERWESYLHALAWETPGWAGMVYWREDHPEYRANQEAPVALVDFLAVRLFLDRLWIERLCRDTWGIAGRLGSLRAYFENNVSEFFVRHGLFTATLPEYLAASAQKLIGLSWAERSHKQNWRVLADMIWTWQHGGAAAETNLRHTVYRSAWRLFRLAQHLGLAGSAVRTLPLESAERLLQALDECTPNRKAYLWLQAYERHYRQALFNALEQNHGRNAKRDNPTRPAAQLIFCMDDREESIRRHLEELNPAIETLGAAGFFGVAMRWQGVNDSEISALCPVVVTPAHEIHEVPQDASSPAWRRHQRRQKLIGTIKSLFSQESRRNLAASPLLVASLAPAAALDLAGRLLAPDSHERLRQFCTALLVPAPATRLALRAGDGTAAATPQTPRLGFTDVEQADRVEGFLRAIGLTSNFAPLVVLAGHGASSQNNPHAAAYDCGACSGRHGGPNARVFAAMANSRAVRALLAERGLAIPDDTWFLGTNHNTTSEEILWFDLADMPGEFLAAQQQLAGELAQAAQWSAHERCRRFASAPPALSLPAALRHVIARSTDIAQARPELGHACNAAAVIGRRAITRGVFFDRRLFLISYDASTDPTGKILENILMAAGPVSAGINLEYFFSRVNNEAFGAGSKAQHNVSGLFGVMEGAASDLRTGFPRQMIELHEPMRLQLVVEASIPVLQTIYDRQPPLRELIGNEWLLLSAMHPQTGEISVFDRQQGFRRWQAHGAPLPEVGRSMDWYAGHDQPLPPAFIGPAPSPSESRHAV